MDKLKKRAKKTKISLKKYKNGPTVFPLKNYKKAPNFTKKAISNNSIITRPREG
jgi:hypothetical protein